MAQCPWLNLPDATLQWSAAYATPEPRPGPDNSTITTAHETVTLMPCAWPATNLTVWPLSATNHTVQILATHGVGRLFGRDPDLMGTDPRCGVRGPGSTFGWISLEGQTRLTGLLSEPLLL